MTDLDETLQASIQNQLRKEESDEPRRRISKSPSRLRSWSSHELGPTLSPSPSFSEGTRRTSKDDIDVALSPVTPKRPSFPRGLSLQMPAKDINSTSTANSTTRPPLSPKPDPSVSYGSPGSVIPRRSRGLDFSRACTNLHHSTLADQSSPDSSPTIGARGMMIPPRKGLHHASSISMIPDSPGSMQSSLWSTTANPERVGISSSVGSVNMMDFDSGSTSSDGDNDMGHIEDEDTIHTTPQVYRLGTSPFAYGSVLSPGGDAFGGSSSAAINLMSFQRARLRSGRSRKSSSSASGHSSMHSPGPVSPPLLKSIEGSLHGGYFPKDLIKKDIESRRESLSLGTNDLHLSDDGESDEGGISRMSPSENGSIPTPVTPNLDERKNVIRRAVTRRGNMLPKPKNFARIRAALQEECAPVDSEVRREAEVIRQVRESDVESEIILQPPQPTTTASSPTIIAQTAGPFDLLEDIPEDEMIIGSGLSTGRRSSSTFNHQAMVNSGGLEFWNSFDERMRTPPPSMFPRGSSSGISDDISMDTPLSSVYSVTSQQNPVRASQPAASRSSTPQPPTEIPRMVSNKRRRDDDFDPGCLKRRAVSPGMSLQNSPILPQSPLQKDSGWWGVPLKPNREVPSVSVSGDRVSSGGSVSSGNGSGPPKRIGFQGMNDTNDGLMNMSID